MANDLEIEVFRGDSYPITFTVTDKASGVAIDLTGAAAVMTVDTLKNPPDTTTRVFSVTGVLDAVPTSGRVAFTPTTTHTATAGKYYYDVQLTLADGSVRTIAKSTFSILMDITK